MRLGLGGMMVSTIRVVVARLEELKVGGAGEGRYDMSFKVFLLWFYW